MQPSDHSTVILLVILLIGTNLKAIVIYLEWLRFKIQIFFKHLENERNHNPDN